MKKIIFLFMTLISLRAEDFISEFEYGQMLYRDPRGISCVPCHGETGEGRYIVSYKNKIGEEVELSGPDIRSSTLEQIRRAVLEGKGLMPKYFLTDQEVRTIHAYLQKLNNPSDTEDDDNRTSTEANISNSKPAPTKEKKKKIDPWEGLK